MLRPLQEDGPKRNSSAVLQSGSNYRLNPNHPDFEQIRHEGVDVDLDECVYRLGQ